MKQRFELELTSVMESLGYKCKKGSLTFVKNISSNVSWSVFFQTLQSYPVGEKVTYIPRVGIRYKDVELTMRKLSEYLQSKKYVLDTVSTYLFNIVKEMPLHMDYTNKTAPEDFNAFILKMIEDWANPYFEKYSDIANSNNLFSGHIT